MTASVARRAASRGDDREATARIKAVVFGALFVAAFALSVGLGIWQVQRLAWKTDLIRTVDRRVSAEPVAAPGPAAWPDINARDDAYRRLSVIGRYAGGKPALVKAVTVRGAGFWVVSAFVADAGFTVLINRGFVSAGDVGDLSPAPQGEAQITGLLRITEPGGGFLRSNDPAADRWYSRDVAAIAASRNLAGVAPYFIDAAASASEAPGAPVGGLTVVSFRNNHLIYALTWFGLAAMLIVCGAFLIRQKRRNPA